MTTPSTNLGNSVWPHVVAGVILSALSFNGYNIYQSVERLATIETKLSTAVEARLTSLEKEVSQLRSEYKDSRYRDAVVESLLRRVEILEDRRKED